MKLEINIVLPNNKLYKVWIKNPDREWTKEEFDLEVKEYTETITENSAITIAIINENGEKETLILWGDVLKNTYLRAKLS